jgi:hypothetical protein
LQLAAAVAGNNYLVFSNPWLRLALAEHRGAVLTRQWERLLVFHQLIHTHAPGRWQALS